MRATSKRRDSEFEPEQHVAAKTPQERENAETKEPAGTGLDPAQSAVLGLQRSLGNRFVVEMLQGKCSCGGTCPKCSAAQSSGLPLDTNTREAMESRLGHDFSDVRVHNDAEAAGAADDLDAQAFTVGSDVFFADGKYHGDPADPLLAHELTHVAQQSGNATSSNGAGSPGLEAQAEQAERAVVHGESAGVKISAAAPGIQRKAADATETDTEAPPQPAKHKTSLLERAGHAISGAAGTAWKGIKTAGKAIGKGAQAAGEAVWSGMKWLGKHLSAKVTGVFDRVMYWVTRLPERLSRLVLGLWEGVKTMRPWALQWWESLGHADTWIDFLQWLGKNLIYMLEVLGIGEAYETAMDFLKFNTRPLTGGEVSKAQGVFGASINLELVRVDEHAVIGPMFSGRAYTSFHVINNWGGLPDETLIHELTHVWQYQQVGAIYMAQALHAQATGGYKYGGAPGLRSAKTAGQGLLTFNREQQAQIVEDYYLLKNQRPVFFGDAEHADLPLYAHFVKTVSTLSVAELTT